MKTRGATRLQKLTLVALALLGLAVLGGCCTKTSLVVRNRSAGPITVQSTQTMKSHEIGPGAERCIPHTSGDIAVTDETLKGVARFNLEVPSYEMDKASFWAGLPCLQHYAARAEYSTEAGLAVVSTRR
jgi:hypothetical protein